MNKPVKRKPRRVVWVANHSLDWFTADCILSDRDYLTDLHEDGKPTRCYHNKRLVRFIESPVRPKRREEGE